MNNILTEPYGIIYQISRQGYDDDEVTELLCSLDAISGIETSLDDNVLSFSIPLKRSTCTLFRLPPPYDAFLVDFDSLKQSLFESAIFPVDARHFIEDISPYITGNTIPLNVALDNKDDIIIAVYRLIHTIFYE